MFLLRSRALPLVLSLLVVSCKTDATTTPPSQNPGPSPGGAQTITLNSSNVYQTITGWELPVLSTVRDYTPILGMMGRLLDQAVNDIGLNKIAIEVPSGAENPSGACQQQYIDGVIDERTFIGSCAYNIVNDNSDPSSVNAVGFHFVTLDWQVENMLLPMKQRVEARGEKLFVQLRYIDFGSSSFEHYQNADEYAEFMQVVFEHLRSKYGFVPDAVDTMNEADQVSGWSSPPTLGRSVLRAGQRLEGLGYRPDFVGASTVNKGNAASYFDGMMSVPGVRTYLKSLSWHCYSDSGTNSSAAIGAKAVEYGVRTSQTECWADANTAALFHQELKVSRNSSWQLGSIRSTYGYYAVTGDQFTIRDKAKFIRQYFKYIRAGARRIDAASSNPSFDPVAFINTDGRYVVVVKASAGGTFTVGNLPAGTYGTYYTTGSAEGTTASAFDVTAPDVNVGTAGTLSASIPSTGVITVFAKTRSNAVVAPAEQTAPSASPGPVTALIPTGAPSLSAGDGQTPGLSAPRELAAADGTRLQLEWCASGLQTPVDLAVLPDGRVLVAERSTLLVIENGVVAPTPALRLEAGDESRPEALLGLAVDPAFDRTQFVYTLSAHGSERRSFRVSRYRLVGGTLGEQAILLDDVDASTSSSGALRAGSDGLLYVALDDAGQAERGGDLGWFSGKVLRIRADGTVPEGDLGRGPVYAVGMQAPRSLAVDPASGVTWVADSDGAGVGRFEVIDAPPSGADGQPRRFAFSDGSVVASVAFSLPVDSGRASNDLLVLDETSRLMRLRLDGASRHIDAVDTLIAAEVDGEFLRVMAVAPDGTIYVASESRLGRIRLEPKPAVVSAG